jgi:thiamine-phosphate pyrophosphorylase
MSVASFELCVITGEVEQLGRGHLEVARAALEGGATMIQLRDKRLPTRALLALACEIGRLCRAKGATFIVNDRVDVALACGADGVHLGQDDMPADLARRLLGAAAIVGVSAADPEQARAAEAAGASYLGVGPIFPTGSKADAGEAFGHAALTAIARATSLPVLAIGGLTCDNVRGVIAAGATGAAVISAVTEAVDMVASTRFLLQCVREARDARRGAVP